ncbi:hypothetical protein L6452_36995 [Arctium lappa]|uniref:Uncharacterized protein n=1 Tax=Arctium lappa TaxID=4217 RepID=A0ACB8Y5Y9_ARCLA|nr:hypothetical protein L6452_36995 [Arctium lappa]
MNAALVQLFEKPRPFSRLIYNFCRVLDSILLKTGNSWQIHSKAILSSTLDIRQNWTTNSIKQKVGQIFFPHLIFRYMAMMHFFC